MRNSKSNTGQELYESIMSDLKPIVKSLLGQAMGLKPKNSHKLNEDYQDDDVFSDDEILSYMRNPLNKEHIINYLALVAVDDGLVCKRNIQLAIDYWTEVLNDKEEYEHELQGFINSMKEFDEYVERGDTDNIIDGFDSYYGEPPIWDEDEEDDDLDESKKTTKNSHKLNEMSDEMLDRAIVAAVDKGDFERAKKFSDYKKSDERKQNMEKAESQRPKNDIRYKINARGGSKEYIDGVAGGVITKTYYGKINIFKIYTDEITDMFADMLLILCKDKNKDISLTFTKDIDGNRPGSVQTGTRCDNKLGSNRIEKLKSTQMFKSLESILSGKKGNEFLTTLTKLKFSQMTNGSETVIKVSL